MCITFNQTLKTFNQFHHLYDVYTYYIHQPNLYDVYAYYIHFHQLYTCIYINKMYIPLYETYTFTPSFLHFFPLFPYSLPLFQHYWYLGHHLSLCLGVDLLRVVFPFLQEIYFFQLVFYFGLIL